MLLRQVELEAGNSLGAGVQLDAQVWGARCGPQPLAPPPPPEHERAHLSNGQAERERERGTLNGFAGARADGVHVTLERAALGAHQPPTRVARLTIDHARLWAGRGGPADAAAAAPAPADEAWCAGWVRLGRAAAPFSLKLVPGTLALQPPSLHFVTAAAEAPAPLDVYARNEFAAPVYVSRVRCPAPVEEHFHLEWATPLVVAGGGRARLGRLALRRPRPDLVLDANLTVVTNVTEYALPLMVYSGKLAFEWEWPRWSSEHLDLGGVGTSSTRRVGLRLVNGGPAPLCVRELRAQLPGAQLALAACAHLRPPPPEHACRCVAGGRAARAWLTVVAPAREGPLQGTALVATEHAAASATVTLHAHKGRVHAHPLLLYRAAPYARSSAPLVLESSMALKMRLANVTQPEPELDPALSFLAHEEEASPEVGPGRRSVGRVLYAPERGCAPRCYAGLDAAHPDGELWLRRAAEPDDAALAEDAALHAHRHALYRRHPHATNVSLHVHTTQVVQIPVSGVVQWWWPRLVEDAAGVGEAGLAAVGAAVRLPLRVRNPSPTHRLLLQPVVSEHKHILAGEPEAPSCGGDDCLWAEGAFRLGEWRATRGAAAVWGAPRNGTGRATPVLLLEPDAEVELTLTFAPEAPAALAAHLYLRNNLTIIESVVLRGRGAYPSFELGGRKPGAAAPLVFEVSECDGGGEAPATVVRTVIARNTGAVPVRLRDWRVAGQPCWARGFSVQPCAPLTLAPNESRPLRLAFTADFTLARVPARLHVRADAHRAEFSLLGAAPARLLARCHARAPPPPFDPLLRAAATLLAVAALALAIAAAALDAERELRRARASRPASPARPPLDLRAVAAHAPQPTPAPAPAGTRLRAVAKRRRPTPRRPVPAPDPHAERRAFDRWRSEVLRAPDDDEDRSSEDADDAAPDRRPPSDSETRDASDERPSANDGYEADPETEERPTASGDEDAASTGSASGSSSTPADEREDDEDDDAEDCDEPENMPLVANGEPRDASRAEPALRFDAAAAPAEELSRAGKVRREADGPRRNERSRPGEGGDAAAARGRHASAKHHARKEKAAKRRAERPPPSPPRGSPPRAGDARAPGAVRWGASWSSVVAARGGGADAGAAGGGGGAGTGALAPIGSDVRRRAEAEVRAPPLGADNSLFFFNGEPRAPPLAEAEFAWRAPAPDECAPFTPPTRDFLGAEESGVGGAAFRGAGGVWGGWGAWGAVRPPPGFGAPAAPVRAYDPFRSLASIWAPGALDWRPDAPAPAAAPRRPSPPHHPHDDDDI
ncbi:hypothetical protein K1T71_011984 [Dendrolimus kikuchii]|uniref:Uncharacterized protein n=1 Tax=Dendrolimus kikuchii TaxID=765133 RepID=A0ACC1CMN7_9NEOP|nr:hypothetical protein K1T71_011984 [Dendrolimus kikuchii]